MGDFAGYVLERAIGTLAASLRNVKNSGRYYSSNGIFRAGTTTSRTRGIQKNLAQLK